MEKNYGCPHWHSVKDVVALKCPCHGDFHPCLLCHEDKYARAPERWKKELWEDEEAILCRMCGTSMTIGDYMRGNSACPECNAGFNPGCKDHWHLYFVMD